MKFMQILFIVIACWFSASAHEESTHQYLTKEAFNLLKRNLGEFTVLSNHLHSTYPAENGGPWQSPFITRGAYREDLEDPVYKYNSSNPAPTYGDAGGTVPLASTTLFTILNYWFNAGVDPFVSTTHFWDADLGDNHITNMHAQSLLTDFWIRVPNSYQKMLAYRDGDYDLIINLILYGFPTHANGSGGCATQRAMVHFEYNSLIDLYVNKNLYVTKVTWLDGSQTTYNQRIKFQSQHWSSLNDGSYSNFLDIITFETLGRMCHLLQDVSVPAHVHVDEHGPFSRGDSFEDFMENDRTWDALRVEQEVGNFINPVAYSNPLHYLMFITAQMADHFGSNGPYEGNGNNTIAGNYSSQELTFLNNINLSSLGSPTTTRNPLSSSEKQNVRNKMIPQAIRATAGLLYWFATEANLQLKTPSFTVTPTVNNVGTVYGGYAQIISSFNIFNDGETPLTLKIKTTNPNSDLDLSTSGKQSERTVSLAVWQSATINYQAIAPLYAGAFIDVITIDALDYNIHKTHTIIGTVPVPDFCFAETNKMAASPEEELFDRAFKDKFLKLDSLSKQEKNELSPKEKMGFAYEMFELPANEPVSNACIKSIDTFPNTEMDMAFYALGVLWESSLDEKTSKEFNIDDFKKYLSELVRRKEKHRVYGYSELILS